MLFYNLLLLYVLKACEKFIFRKGHKKTFSWVIPEKWLSNMFNFYIGIDGGGGGEVFR